MTAHYDQAATKPQLLAVDDEASVLGLLAAQLEDEFEVTTAIGPEEGIRTFRTEGPFPIVLSDYDMPAMTGVDMLRAIEELDADSIRMMVTGHLDLQVAVDAVNQGHVFRFLTKPWELTELRSCVRAGLEQYYLVQSERDLRANLARRVDEQVREIASAHMGMIFALSRLAESRDPETGEHLLRIREYCRILADEMVRGHPDLVPDPSRFVELVFSASPLHDIGKVGVPDSILLKPGRLEDVEMETMRTHAAIGAETLAEVDREHPGNDLVTMGREIALGHHERWNGTGYPQGLAGEDIPLSARIVAVADVWDALTSKRCYKDAIPPAEATDMIAEGRGTQFDPRIVDAFLARHADFLSVWRGIPDPQ
jgi:putative two-component system response regulator